MYSYQSPIIVDEKCLSKEMENDFDKTIFKIIRSYGIKVDKERLIEALNNDYKQYEQGYNDGKETILQQLQEFIDKRTSHTDSIHVLKEMYDDNIE